MRRYESTIKRIIDILVSLVLLVLTGWVLIICLIIARVETGLTGLFRQERVGKNSEIFSLYKLRTMRNIENFKTTVTTDVDPRITISGRVFRKSKIDELPQLFNVLKGDMSLVGPRPDVPGFADKLKGDDRLLLTVRPGITGPASILYKNEEELLAKQDDPEKYNREVIWPDKVKINVKYVKEYSLVRDLYYLYKTVFS